MASGPATTNKLKTMPRDAKWQTLLDSLEAAAHLASELDLKHTRTLLEMALLDALEAMECSEHRTIQ